MTFAEQALEEVIEVTMLYGRFPAPTKGRQYKRNYRPKQFDLYDFLEGKLGKEELLEFFVLGITDWARCGQFEETRQRHSKWVEKLLTEYLPTQPFVIDLADRLLEEYNDEFEPHEPGVPDGCDLARDAAISKSEEA